VEHCFVKQVTPCWQDCLKSSQLDNKWNKKDRNSPEISIGIKAVHLRNPFDAVISSASAEMQRNGSVPIESCAPAVRMPQPMLREIYELGVRAGAARRWHARSPRQAFARVPAVARTPGRRISRPRGSLGRRPGRPCPYRKGPIWEVCRPIWARKLGIWSAREVHGRIRRKEGDRGRRRRRRRMRRCGLSTRAQQRGEVKGVRFFI